MPHLLKSRASALRVLEETLPALWQLWYHSWIVEIVVKSLSTSPINPGHSENAHPELEAPVPALAQIPALS